MGLPAGSTGRLSLVGLARAVDRQATAELPGALPQLGFVDLNLMGFARARGIPVNSLDTMEIVAHTMQADPNGADAAGDLRHSLRRRETLRDMLAWMQTAYGRGRVAEGLAVLLGWQAEAGDFERMGQWKKVVLVDRNRVWTPLLDAILARPGFHFVAFGAGHLPGEDGVVSLLRRQGWQVLPCPGDVCPALAGREG